MNLKSILIIIGVVIVLVVGYFVFFTEAADDTTVQNQTTTPVASEQAAGTSQPTQQAQQEASTQSEAQSAGAYVTYADYQANPGMYNDGTIVYFFNASWCPTCKVLDRDINESLSDIPAGTAIVSVDYDEYTDLKRQYGVTYQHTIVQVDAVGNQIKKWSGGNTLESVLEEV